MRRTFKVRPLVGRVKKGAYLPAAAPARRSAVRPNAPWLLLSGYPIDRGVPIPRVRPQNRYPFRDMAIGDSFFVPASALPRSGVEAVRQSARSRGMRVLTRAERHGYRIWRLS